MNGIEAVFSICFRASGSIVSGGAKTMALSFRRCIFPAYTGSDIRNTGGNDAADSRSLLLQARTSEATGGEIQGNEQGDGAHEHRQGAYPHRLERRALLDARGGVSGQEHG